MTETNRYSRGKIYKICRDDCSDIYIGSTVVPTLAKRLGEHVRKTKLGTNKCTSVQLVNRPGYYIVLLENYPCTSRDMLEAREQFWIDSNKDAVNRNRAWAGVSGSTKQEYQQAYQQKYKEERYLHRVQYRKKMLNISNNTTCNMLNASNNTELRKLHVNVVALIRDSICHNTKEHKSTSGLWVPNPQSSE